MTGFVALVNGVSSNAVPVDDRGLHYGDGLFETIAVEDGKALCLLQHILRLQQSCSALGIFFPPLQQIVSEVRALADGHQRAVCKVIITRGSGRRGYRPEHGGRGQRVILLYPGGSPPDGTPVRIRVCRTRLGRNPALAGHKHLNRLEQVLASAEWDDAEVLEGLMLDSEGLVIEGTMSNVFAVSRGTIITPDLSRCGVAGIVRQQVMELAAKITGQEVAVGDYTLDDVLGTGELFLCNSIREIMPVGRVDESPFTVGSVTEAMRKAVFHERRQGR